MLVVQSFVLELLRRSKHVGLNTQYTCQGVIKDFFSCEPRGIRSIWMLSGLTYPHNFLQVCLQVSLQACAHTWSQVCLYLYLHLSCLFISHYIFIFATILNLWIIWMLSNLWSCLHSFFTCKFKSMFTSMLAANIQTLNLWLSKHIYCRVVAQANAPFVGTRGTSRGAAVFMCLFVLVKSPPVFPWACLV
jgi:hypothetical protein